MPAPRNTLTGVVKRLVRDKGFGFIADATARPPIEYFFHRSAVQRPTMFEQLEEGDAVTFEADAAAPKGPRAITVRRERD